MTMSAIIIAATALVVLPVQQVAQPPAPAQAAPSCASAEYRQFDFWIGEWDVFTPDGQRAGGNRIERILDGCALQEHWTGSRGLPGTSLNAWSATDRKWRQSWIDGRGTRLDLAGGLVDGRMVLEGDALSSAGGTIRNRITWEPLADGRVSQHWQASSDSGKTWRDAFLGFYVKVKPPAAIEKKGKR